MGIDAGAPGAMPDRSASMSVRERVFHILTPETGDEGLERVVNIGLAALILASVLVVALETVESLADRYQLAFVVFDILSVSVFAVEYLLRVWCCTADPRYAGRWGRLRYVLSPMALVDLISISPSIIPGGSLDLRFARSLRLLRLTRALKIARYSTALRLLGRVVSSRRAELGVAALTGSIVLVCAASALYFAEHDAQPQAFSSIPASLWWAVMTLTTVGYGDVYPVTALGKIFASLIAVLGIGLFALPAAILSGGFVEELRAPRRFDCPHCGREVDPSAAQRPSA
jgi:voltage-gated potassium channel